MVFTVTVYHKFAICYLLVYPCYMVWYLLLVYPHKFVYPQYPHKFAIWYLLLQCIIISLLYGIYCHSVSS